MQKKTARSSSGMTRSCSFSAAFLSLVLIGASAAHAQDAPVAPETEARASDQAGIEPRSVDDSALRRGQPIQVEDADGDGLPDAAAAGRPGRFRAGKVDAGNALNAGAASSRAGDPIPGIDITVNQGPKGDGAAQVSPSVRGRAGTARPQVQSPGTGSDPTAEPVPALDPNPVL